MHLAHPLLHGKPPRMRGWLIVRVGFALRGTLRYARLITHTLTLHASVGEESAALATFSLTGASVVGRGGKEVVVITRRGEKVRVRVRKEAHYPAWLDGCRAGSFEMGRFYDVGKVIGRGAFSEVFCGGAKESDDAVAVKVVDKKGCGEREREHARCEARLLSFTRHPSIVECFDIFDTEDNLCVVMRWMAGGTLEDCLAKVVAAGRERWAVVGIVLSNMLSALAYMHENGVVHRDVKVDNVLMGAPEGDVVAWARTAVISDFGLAAYVQDGEELDKVVGTYHYLAPEVLKRGEDGGFVGYGPEVDVWAAGCVLYWLLTGGKLPLERAVREMVGNNGDPDDPMMVCRVVRGVKDEGLDFSELEAVDGIPPAAVSLLKGMLAPAPSKRLSAFGALTHPFLDGVPRVLPGATSDANNPFLPPSFRHPSADDDDDVSDIPSLKLRSHVGTAGVVRRHSEDGGILIRTPISVSVARWQRAAAVAVALVRLQDTLRPKAGRRRVRFGLPANQRAENRISRKRIEIEPAPNGIDGMRYNVGLIPFPRRPAAPANGPAVAAAAAAAGGNGRISISSSGSAVSGSLSSRPASETESYVSLNALGRPKSRRFHSGSDWSLGHLSSGANTRSLGSMPKVRPTENSRPPGNSPVGHRSVHLPVTAVTEIISLGPVLTDSSRAADLTRTESPLPPPRKGRKSRRDWGKRRSVPAAEATVIGERRKDFALETPPPAKKGTIWGLDLGGRAAKRMPSTDKAHRGLAGKGGIL